MSQTIFHDIENILPSRYLHANSNPSELVISKNHMTKKNQCFAMNVMSVKNTARHTT